MIYEKTEKVDTQVLSKLIDEAIRKETVPSDFFTMQMFSNFESIFMQERKETGKLIQKTIMPQREMLN